MNIVNKIYLKSMKALAFLLLLTLAACYNIRENHEYWYTANKKTAQSGVPFADIAWNYCDYKCTSFEKLVPGVDFYIINFSQSAVTANFAACYGKSATGQIQIWNKYVQNSWFDKNCGSETEDYLSLTTKYTIVSQEGQGIGANFNY